MTDISARQYGGYGVGGFVECCEGVVDPLFLLSIIAGLHLIIFLNHNFIHFSTGWSDVLDQAAGGDQHHGQELLQQEAGE